MRTAALIGDADRAAVVEQHPFGEHIGEDVEVRATLGVGQIGARRSPALAAFLRHLIEPDALLRGAVEIAVDRALQPSRGFDEIVGTGMRILLIADRKSTRLNSSHSSASRMPSSP